MRTSTLLVSFLLVATAFAEVGTNDLQMMRKLVTDGKYEEALQQHLWFHEESKKSPGMAGVRLSFALMQWVELGQKYPVALEALKRIRDQDEALLMDGKGDFPEFHDFSAISRELKENDRTYQLFRNLDAKNKELASKCFHVATDLLIEHGDYVLCASYIADPVQAFEDIRQMRELNLSLARRNPKMQADAQFKDYTEKTFRTKTLQLIDVMVHVNKLEEAREIQKRALEYFPDEAIKAAVPSR